jgi:hypothetical protein
MSTPCHAAFWSRGAVWRPAALVFAAAAPVLLATSPLSAQVGAFGAAPAGLDAQGAPQAHVRSPILTESAVFSPAGTWSGTFLAGVTTGSIDILDLEYDVTQTAAAAYYSLSDELMVGVSFLPWNEISVTAGGQAFSESGRGDASVNARYRVWESPDQATSAALFAGLGLPVAAEGFGTQGVVLGLGGAVSRQLDGASLHGSVGAAIPSDEEDGKTTLRFSGAAVYGVGERVAVAGELQALLSDGEHIVNLAPGIRFQPTPRVFLDAAVLVNLATSLEHIYDAGLVLAVRIGGN